MTRAHTVGGTMERAELDAMLAAVAVGDRAAFTEFYRATSPRVYGLALRVVRHRAAAEEITQEVYLQVWQTAARYDAGMSTPTGWLLMLTHRRAVDRVRRETAASARELVFGHAHRPVDHDVVTESVTRRLEASSVVDGMRVLTPVQREAITLAYYGGRSYTEVADHLGIPLSTVKSRIRDGLRRLRVAVTDQVVAV
ncbi:ECF RNA polymerase sigma factor SigK [Nocardia asteroides]|uniref:ECF RNA polymerase sigma factor SigK n=1 Tax=Nocardia asteroides TaxID=1824 RepID=UPI001E3FE154|nr:ECF RNA polymerase sigma factor SigK [Nocardia asteroides]UGT63864.1 ECF RNA polymerase sigma factor SigK [Nocardia asteroides]